VLTVQENIDRCAEAVVQVRTPVGLGSGFVIHPDGYVITNQHVVSGEHQITVTLFKQGESELEHVQYKKVRIVAMSPHADLALLKIEDGEDYRFKTVPFGDSGTLRQGQTVFAVGSPLGLDRSVSEGIISLTNRVLEGKLFVQTTAQVNPGNSGGPLFNLRGEVIGINDLKLVGIGLEGLSFAIPINVLKEFLNNRSAFAFDARNPNAGFRYNDPPTPGSPSDK
jgi:serine protease Do